jgi:hypothetical protein
MVSMTIFAVVMLSATAAYLAFIAYNRQAQATAAVMNSLSFSVDTMAREIRSGAAYNVPGGNGTSITFTNANGCAVTYNFVSPSITRTVTDQNGCTDVEVSGPVTDYPAVTVQNFKVFYRGQKGGANPLQPMVVLDINGYATVANTGSSPQKVYFKIQTSATQRLPNL